MVRERAKDRGGEPTGFIAELRVIGVDGIDRAVLESIVGLGAKAYVDDKTEVIDLRGRRCNEDVG
jgi:hypothetical protein